MRFGGMVRARARFSIGLLIMEAMFNVCFKGMLRARTGFPIGLGYYGSTGWLVGSLAQEIDVSDGVQKYLKVIFKFS